MIEFFKKVFRNKLLVISICIVLICILFVVARKIIDDYESGIYDASVVEGGEFWEEDEVTGEKVEPNILEDIFEESVLDSEVDSSDKDGGNEEEGMDSAESEDADIESGRSVKKIFVHVAGEVNNPGVVSLNDGARIVDAINAAGGTTPNAEISKVNLAYVLKDGMKVNIPNKNQLNDDEHFAYVIIGSGNTDNMGDSISDFYMSERRRGFFCESELL